MGKRSRSGEGRLEGMANEGFYWTPAHKHSGSRENG